MRPVRLAFWLLLLGSGLAPRAAAAQDATGPFTDALSRCIVTSSTATDKTMLVKWIFAVMSLHPAVQPMAAVSDSARTQLNQAMAVIAQRLLTVSCLSEVRAAIKYEGTAAIEVSFGVLGEVAMRDLFDNPRVSAGASAFAQYLDEDELTKALQPSDSE